MKFSKDKKEIIISYLLEKIAEGRDDAPKLVSKEFEINLNTVHTYLNELIDQGRIIREKRGVYKLNENRVSFTFTRSGGDLEDDGYIFEYIVEPQIAGLSDTIRQIWYYAVSEMINNVIDHSEAENVHVTVVQDIRSTTVIIQDDGIGIFRKLQEYYGFRTFSDIAAELAKGKLTTDEIHHSGEGIFFTSRLMDYFAAVSCGSIFTHNKYSEISQEISVFGSGRIRKNKRGTLIYMSLSNYSNKNALDIFNSYASIEGGFTKTSIPLKNIYDMPPVARSQAKRLVRRLGDFEEVILDFEGMEAIGQGFAHELFVVFQNEHKNTRLIPINSNEVITKMIAHVLNTR
ncbi:MAG: DUF4325 domain-containing protein [Butyrivibrio sp.]|nr:DUF4325 domain-containing protein [Butyrivibrio sp.]